MSKIKVHNLSKLPCIDFDMLEELQGDFKFTTDQKLEKLAKRIEEQGFKYVFQVYEDADGTMYIIDGHHRKKALTLLKSQGAEIPKVPYILIQAKDKKAAIEELLFVNSQFSKINPETTLFEEFGIDLDDLDFEIPEMDLTPIDDDMDIGGEESESVKNLPKLTFGKNQVYMTEEELQRMTEFHANYVDEIGTDFGFVTKLLDQE